MSSPLIALLLLGVAATSTPPADPFTGTWKLDPAKSHFTGQRFELAPAGPNEWKFTSGTMSWKIKADGRDTDIPGGSTALVAKSPTVWQLTDKVNGKVTAVETWTLSPDGKSIEQVTTGTRENGVHFTDTARQKRVAGTRGFGGTWETTEVKQSSPGNLVVSATKNALEIRTENGTMLKCAYDGKASEETGPRATPGLTMACTRPSERAIHLVGRLKGKQIFTMDMSVSANGKTLTSTEHDAGQSRPAIEVYDRA